MDPIKPFFFDLSDDDIQQFVTEAEQILRSGTLVLGPHTAAFEKSFAEFVGSRYAVAVNSGSSALEFLLRLKNVEGTTVLVPTNTNFATVASVLRVGGRVQYLDMDMTTFAPSLQMVEQALAKGSEAPISGVLWVHIGGVISPEFSQVVEYCRSRGLFVFEDAAHAHGSRVNGTYSGNLADGAAFSFFPTKVMTTFEGGMMTLNDEDDDCIARSLRNQGKRGMDFGGLHTDFGNSCRITEVSALLGRIQLNKLPEMLVKRQVGYQLITTRLNEAGIGYVATDHMDCASQYKLIVRLPEGRQREDVKRALMERGVILGGTVYELPCHRQPVFKDVCSGHSFPVADHWCPNHICPPLTSGTTEAEAVAVGDALVDVLTSK